jgi:hypothetical protein
MNKITTIIYLVTVGMLAIFNGIWQVLEICFYGKVQPSVVDSIMGFFIFASIYLNVKHWIDKG